MLALSNVKLLLACIIAICIVVLWYTYDSKVIGLYLSNYFNTILQKKTLTDEQDRERLLAYYENLSLHAVRRRRLPDVIGIGVEKCGSGALINFLGQHPLIKVQTKEVHYFDGRYYMGLDYYKSKLAPVADFELSMEKTPAYFNKPEVNVPQMIKTDVPGVKLIVILCDPTNRTFSDFIHEQVLGTIPSGSRFEIFIDQYLRHFEGPLAAMSDRSATSFIKAKDQNFHLSHVISTGLYYYHMKRWFDYFKPSDILILDGEKLLVDPGEVVDEVQTFLALPKLLLPADFQKNTETGFYCVRSLSAGKNGSLHCLESYRKGRTRLGTTTAPEYTMRKLRNFFKPYNEKLFRLLDRNFTWH